MGTPVSKGLCIQLFQHRGHAMLGNPDGQLASTTDSHCTPYDIKGIQAYLDSVSAHTTPQSTFFYNRPEESRSTDMQLSPAHFPVPFKNCQHSHFTISLASLAQHRSSTCPSRRSASMAVICLSPFALAERPSHCCRLCRHAPRPVLGMSLCTRRARNCLFIRQQSIHCDLDTPVD